MRIQALDLLITEDSFRYVLRLTTPRGKRYYVTVRPAVGGAIRLRHVYDLTALCDAINLHPGKFTYRTLVYSHRKEWTFQLFTPRSRWLRWL